MSTTASPSPTKAVATSQMPPPPSPQPAAPRIHTYHCVCSTHILTTPYALPSLPIRAPPSLDSARILPLPTLDGAEQPPDREPYLPSLIHNLRQARKAVVVQREDGWERRKTWRCGRCGVGVGYELEGVEEGVGADEKTGVKDGLRVMYLLEQDLMETEKMMAGIENPR